MPLRSSAASAWRLNSSTPPNRLSTPAGRPNLPVPRLLTSTNWPTPAAAAASISAIVPSPSMRFGAARSTPLSLAPTVQITLPALPIAGARLSGSVRSNSTHCRRDSEAAEAVAAAGGAAQAREGVRAVSASAVQASSQPRPSEAALLWPQTA
jgi:hypothetical protein